MATHPAPTAHSGPGRVRTVAEGVLAVLLLAALVAALVSGLAWLVVQVLLLVME